MLSFLPSLFTQLSHSSLFFLHVPQALYDFLKIFFSSSCSTKIQLFTHKLSSNSEKLRLKFKWSEPATDEIEVSHQSFWISVSVKPHEKITWLHCFRKAPFLKCFFSTRKRKPGVFQIAPLWRGFSKISIFVTEDETIELKLRFKIQDSVDAAYKIVLSPSISFRLCLSYRVWSPRL